MRHVRFGSMSRSFRRAFSCGEKRTGGFLGGLRAVEAIWL